MVGRCYDCKRLKELRGRTPRAKRNNLCGSCSQKRKANADPTFRVRRAVSTHNSRSSTGRIEVSEVYSLYCKQAFKCAYCGRQMHDGFSLDHVQPVLTGGPNVIQNMVLACGECNSSKQHREVTGWLASKGYKPSKLLEERLQWLRTRRQ